MISRYILFFGCLLPCLLSFSVRVGNSQHLGESCSNDTTYNSSSTSGKTYRTNLNFLLSTLTSNASDQPNGFYNFTSGSDPSNTVYGLFLCRGDANTSICQECVARASSDMLQRCPDRKIATIWYDNCMLRYSNQYIFSRVEGFYGLSLVNTSNATDVVLFSQVVQDTMEQIADRASNDLSGKKFAVQEANYSTSQSRRIYALGQCTPDLSSLDCGTCLRSVISYLPTYRQGGRFLCPSCNIRYEVYPFYDIQATPPPPPPPPLSPASSKDNGGIPTLTIVAIVVPICISIALFVVIFCIGRRYRKAYNVIVETTGTSDDINSRESLQYSLSEIQASTNNFAVDNRIGGGGFGSVYKGTLPNGREIAVKRLSRSSSQGAPEFINEIALLAKLQHRNLVRLLGYCLEGEERILVYEFVPNRSLDYFLFDPEKQPLLDWSKRYKIIGGIARGLLYLHEDSRLKVIHRDLKASNVLLDQNMNPKIADFGMARLFEVDQSEGNTNKIVGTYGYMSPEYAMHGMFSVKSDVFSFGVLILEIISGKSNSSFFQSHGAYLSSYAWRQWRDGTPLALLDPSIGDSEAKNEIMKSIHIGLLCVQDDAEQRPTMASVVLMLNSFSLTIPTPNPPAFFGHNRTGNFFSKELSESDKSSTTKSVPEFSRNDASITELYPR